MSDTDGYTAEQAGDGTGMDTDLIPWLERTYNVDVTLSEFPYWTYSGVEDDPTVREWMDAYGAGSVWALPDHLRESATYRTDVVGVRVDRRSLDRRERAVGSLDALTEGDGWGINPTLRAFLNLRRDGPMSRREFVHDHGLDGEPNAQPPEVTERAVQRLADRGFLATNPGENTVRTALSGLHLAAVHAVELKREAGEWRTALEQADRASVYAGHRWVCMSERTADRALANRGAFKNRGVGLLTVSSSTGEVAVHVPAERSPPDDDRELLSRPNCERWALNERVLTRLDE